MERVDSVPCLCPSCDRVVLGPAKHLDKTVRCPGCQQRFTFSYPPPEVLASLTEPVVRENTVLPLVVDDEAITIGCQDPDDLELQQKLEFAAGRRVRLKRVPLETIAATIERLYCVSVPCLCPSCDRLVIGPATDLGKTAACPDCHKEFTFCIPPAALTVLPRAIVRANAIVPLAVDDEAITFATNDPDGSELQLRLLFEMDRRIRWRKTPQDAIAGAIETLYGQESRFPSGADLAEAVDFAGVVESELSYAYGPRGPEDEPIVCRCATCDTRYVLGVNALAIVFEESIEDRGPHPNWDAQADNVPDLIGLRYAAKSWPDGVPPPAPRRVVPAAVLEAQRRKVPRLWRCANCQSPQPYAWSSFPERSPEVIFATTLAEAARKVPGEAVRSSEYINPQIAWEFGVLAFAVEGDDLHVAIVEAGEDHAREMTDLLGLLLRRPVKTVAIPVEEMKQGLAREYPEGPFVSSDAAPRKATHVKDEGISADPSEERADREEIQDVELGTPLERLFQLLVAEAAAVGASEVLVRPTKAAIQVFLRIPECPCPYLNGEPLPKRVGDLILNYVKHRTSGQGFVSCRLYDRSWTVQVSFQRTLHGQAVVLSFPERTGKRETLKSEISEEDESPSPDAASSAVRFCPHCGRQVLGGARTCVACKSQPPPLEPTGSTRRASVARDVSLQERLDYSQFWQAWRSATCEKCNDHISVGTVVCPHCDFDHALERRPPKSGIPRRYVMPFAAKHLPPEGEPS